MAASKISGYTSYPRRLETRINPRDDFFGFVNSRWLDAHPIPSTESSWGVFLVLRDETAQRMRGLYEALEHRSNLQPGTIEQQARDFYFTATHDEFEARHLAIVAEYLAKIEAISTTTELSTCLGELQSVGVSVPWGMVVDTDDKNSRKHLLRILQSGLTLPDRDYYLKSTPEMADIRKKFAAHIEKVQSFLPELQAESARFQKTVVDFEHELAKHARSSAALREVEDNYHKATYTTLERRYPNIDWQAFAAALSWKPNDQISVDQPEFMAFINEQFVESKLPMWRAYLKWQFTARYFGRISERFAKVHFEFFGRTLSGTPKILPRWKRAVLLMDYLLGAGVGKLYAEKYFPEASKKQMLELVEVIRGTYRQRLERVDWMDADTKALALKKLANMKVLIGYPDKWRDFSAMNIGRRSFIDNVMAAEKFQTQYYLHRLHEPASRDDWFMHPQTVNAYNDPGRLVICFPAAILQIPFFDPSAPAAVNFAGIGMVIGHEFTHGFDDQGYKFDDHGNVKTWQTARDRQRFAKRAQVIIDQADNFNVLPGVNLQGKLVVGESIADLGGIEIAYEAFQSLPEAERKGVGTLTPEQLFFVSYAVTECSKQRDEVARQYALVDPHPDSKYRVNGILAHVHGFYQAFGVKPGDKLYRPLEDRAKIW